MIIAAWFSFLASILILIVKFFAYTQTGSIAVLSDAVESIVNVIASGIALRVLKAVAEPADDEHPYGHGKLEYFSAAFEGGLIAFASVVIFYESVRALVQGRAAHSLDVGIIVIGVAGILNLILGLYLKKSGEVYKSEALKASSAHVLSDVWTTVGVVGGLALVHLTNLAWLDPVVAMLVAIQLGYSGIVIVRKSAGGLIDEMEPGTLKLLADAIQLSRRPGFIDIHNLRVIRSGSFHHIDAHLVVPEFWNVAKTHAESGLFEKEVVASYPYDGEIAFHIDPCERKYCEICDLSDCPIRVKAFQAIREISLESLIRSPTSE